MNRYVAVYGTLRAGMGNHSLLRESVQILQGKTSERFVMTASGFPICRDSCGCTKCQEAAINAVVEVYDTGAALNPDAVLRSLDALEGHPDWYKRRLVEVESPGQRRLLAWMYVMPGCAFDSHWPVVQDGDFVNFFHRKYRR